MKKAYNISKSIRWLKHKAGQWDEDGKGLGFCGGEEVVILRGKRDFWVAIEWVSHDRTMK